MGWQEKFLTVSEHKKESGPWFPSASFKCSKKLELVMKCALLKCIFLCEMHPIQLRYWSYSRALESQFSM